MVHKVLAIAQNAIMSVAKKVKDNIIHMINATVIMMQPTVLENPVAYLPCTLLKVPNGLVIKQVCIPSGKLKTAKLPPKLAKA